MRRFSAVWVSVFLWSPAPAQAEPASPKRPDQTVDTHAETHTSEAAARKPLGLFDPAAGKMTGDWGGLRSWLVDHGLTISLAYQQQGFLNLNGGADTEQGYRQAGSYDFILKADTQKLGLWPGGYGYIKTKGNWREALGFNAGKIGGLSRPNADEGADDPVFVSKWWVGQRWLDGLFDLRVGRLESKKDLFDLNAYAKNEDYLFINNWFRRNPTVPHTTAGGARLKIRPADWLYFQMGVFDGDSRGSKRGALRTTFHDSATFIGMWELGFTPKFATARGPMPGHYRVGFWYDGRARNTFVFDPDGRFAPRFKGDTVGFYLSLDQMVYKEQAGGTDTQGLGLFFRYGHAKEEVSALEDFWSIGGQYQGLIPKRDRDVLAFGVAQGIRSGRFRQLINSRADRETVYELYYKIEVTPWLAITPDLQYVNNPGALGARKDAFLAGIRLRFIF
ncbi:MAG: carbohydrate porin [Phycisphaerae bacterium]